jgi:hypothetical protein
MDFLGLFRNDRTAKTVKATLDTVREKRADLEEATARLSAIVGSRLENTMDRVMEENARVTGRSRTNEK